MKTASALLAVFFLTRIPEALACVGCRAPGTSGPDEPQTITAGIALSWGVIGMLTVVFLLVTGLILYIAKTCQQLDKKQTIQ
jgi:hypothetical protein